MALETIKKSVKMWSTVHVRGNDPDVFLFSTPRSGSTWLMEMIYSQPGFKWSSEPFDLRIPIVRKYLGITDWTTLYNDSSLARIQEYIEMISAGKLRDRDFQYQNPFGEYYRPITRRTIFKILHGGEGWVNWFRDQFNGEIVYLLRHPIPVSLSRVVLPRLQAFIESDYQRHFSSQQIEFAKRIIDNGTELEKGVLDWCLQNAPPLQQRRDNWTIVTYEQLVLQPEAVIDYVVQRLNFSYPEGFYERLGKPSVSTGLSNQKTQEMLNKPRDEDNKRWLIEKWKPKVSQEEEKRLMETLEMFDLDVYSAGEVLPSEQFWV